MTITSSPPDAPDSYVPSRRTVLRAAAWTAPAVSVAVAVPAYAATSGPVVCADANYEVSWASNYNASSRSAVARLVSSAGAGTLGSGPLTLTVSSQFFGNMEAGSTTTTDGFYSNLSLSPRNVGGTTMRGLTIMQRAKQGVTSFGNNANARSNHRQEVTLVFSRPVTGLKFKLTDIDSMDPANANGQYQDRIWVSGGPAGVKAGGLSGSGTSGAPWRPTGSNTEYNPVSGAQGNVDVSYVGKPASAVYKLTYWNDQSGTLASRGLQGVFLTNLTFTASSCA
nr:hypothetical protein [uncultured Nocardioides sp.]